MSMAALILTAGAPGKRLTLPNGRMLIHQPTGGYQGQTSDIEIHARETLALRAQLDELYAKHTGQSPEQIHDDSDRDRYMTPAEAIAYGLVDRLVAPKAQQGSTRS
jgi:ATP-dependent Clp protease protease subunit